MRTLKLWALIVTILSLGCGKTSSVEMPTDPAPPPGEAPIRADDDSSSAQPFAP